jgi:hypothetical protein
MFGHADVFQALYSIDMRSIGVVLAMALVWGCGGTNTTDGVGAYNRGPGQYDQAPTSTLPGAPGAGEILAVNAFLNVSDVADAKIAGTVVEGLKKLPTPPKRVFLLGATPTSTEWFVKPLSVAKITAIPVVGPKTEGWDKVLKAYGAGKFYGNGPNGGGPNADTLTNDQSKFTSTFAFEGVRFISLNTDSPVKGSTGGAVPKLWLQSKLNEVKEKNVFLLGWRAFRPLGNEDKTPVVTTNDLIGKSSKVRGFISSSVATPNLSRPDEKSLYQLAVGGGLGEDKMPTVGVLEVRKNGAISARLVKLEITKPAKNLLEASLFDPAPAAPNTKIETGPKPVIAREKTPDKK